MNFAFTLVLASILHLASCCWPTHVCYGEKWDNNAGSSKYICDNNGDIWVQIYVDSECSTLATTTLADINDYQVQMVQCDGCTDYAHGRKYDDDAIANCDYDADFGEFLAPLGCLPSEDGSESQYVECDTDSVTVYNYHTNSVCDGIPDESIMYVVGCGVNGIHEVNGVVSEIPMFTEGLHCGSASTTTYSTTSNPTTLSLTTTNNPIINNPTTNNPTTSLPTTNTQDSSDSSNPTSNATVNVLETDIVTTLPVTTLPVTTLPNVNNSKPETVEILFFVCIFTILLYMV